MAKAIVSLGSNIEPREEYLSKALDSLAALPGTELIRKSSVIETEGVGVPDEYAGMKFLNQIAIFETSLDPLAFSRAMHRIEDSLGRVRMVKNGPRTIDIDLIDFDGISMDTPELTLPHPRAKERDFVQIPLREISDNETCCADALRSCLLSLRTGAAILRAGKRGARK